MKLYNVAIVGATGAVGEEILRVLEEIDFPYAKIVPLASARSAGNTVNFNDQELVIQELTSTIFDEEKIEAFRGTVSLPFTPGKLIAVKIIDDRGIESLKIIKR